MPSGSRGSRGLRAAAVGLLAAFLGACGISKDQHTAVVNQLEECRKDAATAKGESDKRLGDLEQKLGLVGQERDTEAKARGQVETQYKATQAELEELRTQKAETEKRLAAFRDLTARFQKMIDAGKIKVGVRNGKMVMQLPASVLFASGKADLQKDGKISLDEVAAILVQFPDRQYLVAGHTDSVPLRGSRFKSNWDLSAARAVTVTQYLIEGGVPAKNLAAAGYGEFDPVADNTTEEGKQQNRRIDIVLQPNIDELPKLPESK